MSQQIIHGDCLNEMRLFCDNHFSGIVTDPPYGLQFMGKQWDQQVPGKEYWKEMLRICKPGAFLLAFGGTRTYHRLACAIEDAGWEIRDCLQWIYGSGFPKSHNHFGIEGFGTALKPAYEPIILAMKPLDGTFAQNAEKWRQAGINIDECRVRTTENLTRECLGHASALNEGYKRPYHEIAEKKIYGSITGRWPANVILDEEAGKMLDEMSENLAQSKKRTWKNPYGNNLLNHGLKPCEIIGGVNDSGGVSRFFYCAKASANEKNFGLDGMPTKKKPLMGEWKNNPKRTTPKSSSTPRENFHPTVKPLKLMEYLLKLIAPPKDALILDPFAGSGTTLLAAKNLGISCIGIEKEEAYCEIIRGRLNVKQLDFMEVLK